MAKFSDYHGVLSVKDPAFGALGNGVADDRAAIQACFDAAFGSSASPHGNSGRFTNRSVYIPPGNYNIGGPLYLTDVTSGKIFGGGENCTRLNYSGSFSGNTVAQGTLSGAQIANVHGITPLIIANGWSHSMFSDINLAIDSGGANSTTCFYLFWNGSVGSGPTANLFQNVLFEGGTEGFLIGYETPGLCSETTVINCTATLCVRGFRVISQNSLDNNFIGCGASSCSGAGFSVPTGTAHIYCASLAGNGTDIVCGQETLTIIACRSESANFVDASASTVPQHVVGCLQSDINTAGYFVNVGNGGNVVVESCIQSDTGSTAGVISGSSGGKVYLRNNEFRNTSYLSSYTGLVSELNIPIGLVSALPTANAKYKGLRALVTDATVTTFASTVAGTGGNTVPVFCDGTNWKIG